MAQVASYPVNESGLQAYEIQVDNWEDENYSPEMLEGVTRLLQDCPVPAATLKPVEKQRVFMLRGRASLLFPDNEKPQQGWTTAEDDFNKVLRLSKKNCDAWIYISECYLRRGMFKEAHDGLDTALSLDPKNVKALIKLSQTIRLEARAQRQLLREQHIKEKAQQDALTASQKKKKTAPPSAKELQAAREKTEILLEEERALCREVAVAYEDSIAKAKEAIALDPNNAAAWNMFGKGQLTSLIARGLIISDVKKIHFAFSQSVSKSMAAGKNPDPECLISRSNMNRLLGDYEAAVSDLELAVKIDPHGLPESVKKEADEMRAQMIHIAKLMQLENGGINERDFKKNFVSRMGDATDKGEYKTVTIEEFLEQAETSKEEKKTLVRIMVVKNISVDPVSQPQMYQCVDRHGSQLIACLSMYRADAIKTGSVLTVGVPPCTLRVSKVSIPGGEEETAAMVSVPFVTLDANGFLVGAVTPKPLAAGFVGTTVSSMKM